MSAIDPADPNTWGPPDWAPEWDGEWELARLKSLALRLLRESAAHAVALDVFEEGYVKVDVFRDGRKQGEVFVNRGMQGEEASYEVFVGREEDHLATEAEVVERILSGEGYWGEEPESRELQEAPRRKIPGA